MKEFLGGLFALLFVAALLLLIIGFFKPGVSLFWYKKPRTKKASATINGLVTLISFILAGILLPPANTDKEIPDSPTSAKTVKTDSTTPPATAPTGPSVTYNVAKQETKNGDLYLKVTVDNMPASDALIEKTRQLRDEYHAKHKFSVYYYYMKFTENTSAIAGVGYLEDCSHCEYKDKEGDKVDMPFYTSPLIIDSLKALHFDTTGFKSEATFLNLGTVSMKNIIMSSDGKDALEIFLSTDGHTTYNLTKRIVDGQTRFYDEADKTSYYVINRTDGFVDFYENGQLDSQHVIEN